MATAADDPLTVQYRLDFAHALHTVSPALSALHTSRFAVLHPEFSSALHPSHCPKCGFYRFSGDCAASLSMGKKRRRVASSHPKIIQRTCHFCGFCTVARTKPSPDHSIDATTTPLFAKQRTKGIRQGLAPCATATTPPAGPLPGRRSDSKPSHTKTSSLKEMLSRDRQREEAVKSHKKGQEAREGLAAFLKEL